jgi:hypothetical protein
MNRANAEIIGFTDWLKAKETILLHFDVQDKQETLQQVKAKCTTNNNRNITIKS